MNIKSYKSPYRWVMLVLVCALYFCFGSVISSIAPMITPILADLNISYSRMGVILGAWPLTYIAAAIIGGTLIDRWGIRKSLFMGILTISMSAGLRYFAIGAAFMFFCVALFGLGGPMISIGAPKTIATWFRGKERGLAVGIYMTGVSLGSLFALSLTNSFLMPLTGYSWRLVFVFYGMMAFITALAWCFLARDTKQDQDSKKAGIIDVFSGIVIIRNVQLVLIIGFLSMVIVHGFANWLPKIMETNGFTPRMAGFAASIPVLTGIPAVLTIPRFTPQPLRGRIITIITFLGAIDLLILATSSGALLISGLCIYGLLFPCATPLLMLVLMDLPEIGSEKMGAAAGMYFCISEIGGFTGPSLMGFIVDITGEFMMGIVFLSVLSVIMSVLAFYIKIQQDKEYK